MSIRTDRVRLAGLLKKKEGLTREEFLSYWLGHHGPLFSSLDIVKMNLTKYEQVSLFCYYYVVRCAKVDADAECHPSAPAATALGQVIPLAQWDGMVIFEGESFEKIMAVFSSAEYTAKVAPDEEEFLDRKATQFLALDLATIIGNSKL
ncbi:hypothetical protein HWV62_43836 [Athelia sp. TMB]|nr:hypothetical protein HWV62_40064 [Athelia sp. TMB]KAF7985921.1 hypothetical protein HWV62_43836 [Athelia sp. TMB]